MVKEGATLCVAGITIGIIGAMALTLAIKRTAWHQPDGSGDLHPVTVAMSVVTLIACYVPTRRAMGVDPLIVLRHP